MAAVVSSYFVWLTFVLPFLGALVMPLLSRAGRVRDYVAVAFPFLSAVCALQLLIPVLQGQMVALAGPTSVPWISSLNISMGVLSDPYTVIISNVVAWVSFLIALYSADYMKGDEGIVRYWFFINFFIGNMQLLVLSDNLLALFIGWEGVGLCSYALIGHYYKDQEQYWVGTPGDKALGEEQAYPPSHAGMKAFIMTRIGDVAMLAGILIVFIYAGTFNYQQLAQSGKWAAGLLAAGLLVPVALLIFGGAVGKSAQFPLQEWLPDAMAGPAPVSALIHAATMVKAGVVLVARIGPIFYFVLASNPGLVQPFFVTVAWIGAFTALLAASQALVGFELKKILAYSTVSQIGYMMMALGLAGLTPDFSQGLSAGLYHLISHAIFKACLFLAAGWLIHTTETKYINSMGGLRSRLKVTFAVFLIAVASLSGFPPLSGFWSKDAILATAWEGGQMGLFVVGALVAGLTAFYSFRMLGLVFFGGPSGHIEELETVEGRHLYAAEGTPSEPHQGKEEGKHHHVNEAPPLSLVPYTVLGLGTLVVGLAALIGLVVPSLNVEKGLEEAARTYLASLFPDANLGGAAAATSFDAVPALLALALVVAGILVASQLYITRRIAPAAIVDRSSALKGIYKFLYNRWYLNAIYYKVFVNAPIKAANWTWANFEVGFLDRINDGGAKFGIYLSAFGNWIDRDVVDSTANGVSTFGQRLSRAARRVQTGIVEQYVLVFAIGMVLILLLFILSAGVLRLA